MTASPREPLVKDTRRVHMACRGSARSQSEIALTWLPTPGPRLRNGYGCRASVFARDQTTPAPTTSKRNQDYSDGHVTPCHSSLAMQAVTLCHDAPRHQRLVSHEEWACWSQSRSDDVTMRNSVRSARYRACWRGSAATSPTRTRLTTRLRAMV
jgi:predicted transposase YbfD/YdcC